MAMSDQIKSLIPSWLNDKEIQSIRSQFTLSNEDEQFLTPEKLRDPKNWKRISKDSYNGVERIFDFKPAGDQLRLYVETDNEDKNILSHYFQGE